MAITRLARHFAMIGVSKRATLDDRWGRYANGTALRQTAFGLSLPMARDIPFDGIVSNERSHYPGLADPARFLPVDGANHQNIHTTQIGLRRVVEAMRLFSMVQAGSLPTHLAASVSGPSTLTSAQIGTWTSTVTGGRPPYRDQWSGMLTGTASSIQGPGEGTVYLDVFDATCQHVTILKRVTLNTECGTKKAC
jgi:hypothetical protein